MFKKILLLLTFFSLLTLNSAQARQGFAVGLGPVGNIFLIDTIPVLDPGVGGHVYFNYRFAEQVAFETTFLISSQDGTNVSSSDKGILLLGMPTLDLKYYFLKDDPTWDPYAVLGVGSYWVTEGSVGNATGGLGLGAQMGLGFDYYLSEQFSLGFSGIFRSIGLITDFGTPSSSTALFPFSLMGNVAFHF